MVQGLASGYRRELHAGFRGWRLNCTHTKEGSEVKLYKLRRRMGMWCNVDRTSYSAANASTLSRMQEHVRQGNSTCASDTRGFPPSPSLSSPWTTSPDYGTGILGAFVMVVEERIQWTEYPSVSGTGIQTGISLYYRRGFLAIDPVNVADLLGFAGLSPETLLRFQRLGRPKRRTAALEDSRARESSHRSGARETSHDAGLGYERQDHHGEIPDSGRPVLKPSASLKQNLSITLNISSTIVYLIPWLAIQIHRRIASSISLSAFRISHQNQYLTWCA
ncbi:hypothetical protein B0T20DRAFT_388500 [Sordaria brevicollis]|uniref:Uncharacterized protein n=1 Tax=Sordaria brevicollis TaxID=83679 RepID=A0AAE0UG51_SORBR|nr:hypothetical protein B0T20DRAFT_388500 [Sordaria brevicollis]